VLQCVAVCCVAVCCSVLQCVAVCCSVLQCVAMCCSVVQYVAVRCSMLQCVVLSSCIAVCVECCRVLQCGAVYFIFIIIRILYVKTQMFRHLRLHVSHPIAFARRFGCGQLQERGAQHAACCSVLQCVVAVCRGPSEGMPYA